MSADDDRLGPSRNGLGDLVENDGFSEDGASKNISDLNGVSCIDLLSARYG